jgi:putative ABC transport system substrate-binding protein
MRRRDFMAGVGGTAALLVAARAQQAMPVVGFLNTASAQGYAPQLAAFLKGLAQAGYVDGRNVTIEYRWAEGRSDRLPELAADLVRRQVNVIAATSTPAALAAKAATATIPIVFETGFDPMQSGIVTSLSRPGGNITGVTQTNVDVTPKRLELLRELLPRARMIGVLVNPSDPVIAAATVQQIQEAGRRLGVEVKVLNARNESDFDGVFASLLQQRLGGLVIGGGTFFVSRREQLGALTLRHAVPAVFQNREFAAAGGLMSYGSDIADAYRLAGVYTGRVLKGDKPADLPVQQATKVELLINLKTAKTLHIDVPLPLLGRADEVIE